MEEEVVPPVRSELAHRPVQVGLGRADRQAEQLGDRPIREATGRERGHLGFAAGEALGQEVPRFGSRDPAPVLLDQLGEASSAMWVTSWAVVSRSRSWSACPERSRRTLVTSGRPPMRSSMTSLRRADWTNRQPSKAHHRAQGSCVEP